MNVMMMKCTFLIKWKNTAIFFFFIFQKRNRNCIWKSWFSLRYTVCLFSSATVDDVPLCLNGRCLILCWKGSYVQTIKIQSTDSHSHFFREQECQFVAYWSKKYKLQFLAVQEDDSEWSTRTWTAQISFQHFQVSYLTTVPPTVFIYSRTARVTVCLLIVFFVFFFLFYGLFSGPAHILCLIVASGWNKERCIPEILPFLLFKIGSCSLLFRGVNS